MLPISCFLFRSTGVQRPFTPSQRRPDPVLSNCHGEGALPAWCLWPVQALLKSKDAEIAKAREAVASAAAAAESSELAELRQQLAAALEAAETAEREYQEALERATQEAAEELERLRLQVRRRWGQ